MTAASNKTSRRKSIPPSLNMHALALALEHLEQLERHIDVLVCFAVLAHNDVSGRCANVASGLGAAGLCAQQTMPMGGAESGATDAEKGWRRGRACGGPPGLSEHACSSHACRLVPRGPPGRAAAGHWHAGPWYRRCYVLQGGPLALTAGIQVATQLPRPTGRHTTAEKRTTCTAA